MRAQSTLALLVAFASMLAGCATHPGPTTSSAAAPTSTFVPTLGMFLNLCCDYVILKERPEHGQLISKEISTNDHPRAQDVYLRIVDRDGHLHDQVFPLPPVGPGVHVWINFTYPDAPAPLLLAATSGRLPLYLATPKVSHEQGDRSYVKMARQTFFGSFPPTDPSAKVTGASNASTPFPVNSTLIQWIGSPQYDASTVRGTVGLRTAGGRDIWVLKGNGFPPLEGTLSEGTAPLEAGSWGIWVNGTGRLPINFNFYYLVDAGWEHYGIVKPS